MTVKVVLQSESAECGLACLASICAHFGAHHELRELRARFPQGLKGLTLQALNRIAGDIGLSARPLRLELDEISQLSLPCVLHWDLNHFVVLEKVKNSSVVLMDPAIGRRVVSISEVSHRFSGVALELTPMAKFRKQAAKKQMSLRDLSGRMVGFWASSLQILALAALLELLNITSPLMGQLIVDDVLVTGDRDLLVVVILGYFLLLVFQTIVAYVRSWAILVMGQRIGFQWVSNVFGHLLRLPPSFFESRNVGDISSRFSSVSSIQKLLTSSAIEAFLDGVMAIAALAMMAFVSPKLMAVVISAAMLYALLRFASYPVMSSVEAGRLVLAARESTHFLETLRSIVPLKLFGKVNERQAQWQSHIIDLQNQEVRMATVATVSGAIRTFIFGTENLVVFWFGANMVLSGQGDGTVFTVGALLAFIGYKSQFGSRFSNFIDYLLQMKMLALHKNRLADIVLESPEADRGEHNDLDHLQPTLELRNVHFRYSASEPWLLKGVNLKVASGESIAICGESGSGKSTLVKVMLGMLKPSSGEVLYGGKPIHQVGLQNYRKKIGTVLQDDTLLSGSISDNISFFDVSVPLEKIEECAVTANIHESIQQMPMGYQTLIGDLGSGISGGQKQRILLARALCKNPSVLLLDEATSHLDGANEATISAHIAALKLTRIMVAHRQETIDSAGRVCRLVNGRLQELRQYASHPVEQMAVGPALPVAAN